MPTSGIRLAYSLQLTTLFIIKFWPALEKGTRLTLQEVLLFLKLDEITDEKNLPCTISPLSTNVAH